MPRAQAGFTLLEALVAMGIVALVVLSFLGIRTSALKDATEARNWRLAREIAEEKLSELNAGARDLPPESGVEVSLEDKYPGFSFSIFVGESGISDMEAQLAETELTDDAVLADRSQWQHNRDTMRRANARGLNYYEYQQQIEREEEERARQEKPPTEDEFEDVAVVVQFPSLDFDKPEGARDAYVLKAKVSTLALSGLTPEQAQVFAESKGLGSSSGGLQPATAGGNNSGGGQ